jgi:hypothetical protein
VEDAIKFEGAKSDPVHALRHANARMRADGLAQLGTMAKTYQYLEAARLLRDKSHDARDESLSMLKSLLDGADGALVAMMIRDLAPHAWHFTDHKEILAWLEQLLAKGEANTPDAKALKAALKGIEKYNKDRGF